MRVTSKGQVTIPQAVREAMGIRTAETEVDFVQDKSGRWYLRKIKPTRESSSQSRFRRAHKAGKLRKSTEDLLKLTRGG